MKAYKSFNMIGSLVAHLITHAEAVWMPQVIHWQEFGRWWAESEPELLGTARRQGIDPDDN